MNFRALKIIFLFLSLVLAARVVQSQDNMQWQNDFSEKNFYVPIVPEDKKKMETLWSEIGEDLKTERNELAGTYAEIGYDGGYFLRWSTGKGFVLIPYFDQSLITDFAYGKVEINNDSEIIFIPERELQSGGRFKETPTVWIPAVGGGYIIPKQSIASFGNFYGGFGEFNGYPRKIFCDECGHFARRVDKKIDTTKISFLAPPKYLKFIKNPINGKITRVGKRWKTKNPTASCCNFEADVSALAVSINVGRKHGANKNLLFLLVDAGDNSSQVLKITRVHERTSEGIVYRVLDKNGRENYDGEIYDRKSESYNQIAFPPIKVGTKITTSPIIQ